MMIDNENIMGGFTPYEIMHETNAEYHINEGCIMFRCPVPDCGFVAKMWVDENKQPAGTQKLQYLNKGSGFGKIGHKGMYNPMNHGNTTAN